jgi:hypothetical protein
LNVSIFACSWLRADVHKAINNTKMKANFPLIIFPYVFLIFFIEHAQSIESHIGNRPKNIIS